MSIFSSNKDTRETATATGYTPPAPSASPASNSSSYSSNNTTSISEGTTLEGHIKIEGDIRIEGYIKGGITSKGKVSMSSTGKVDGDIICQNAEIAGLVKGKLKVADILYLKGNAVIEGDINTGKLVIESGVKFNGNCSMGGGSGTTVTPKVEPTAAKVNLNA